jgi:prevent-host-death family protein
MKYIRISNDIVPIGEFKTGISKWLKNIRDTGHPLIITQNGKPAGVVLSPTEYDTLVQRHQFLESVGRGIADADSGNTYTPAETKSALKNRRSKR